MNIGDVSGPVLVGIGLFVFGLAYNFAVGYLERKHLTEGYTALLVVVGVLATLGGLAIFQPYAAMLALAYFAASGSPMIAGSIIRYAKSRAQARQAYHDDPESAA